MLVGPPSGIAPARLYRLLTARPRPTWPLAFRFGFAPDTRLWVRALRGAEEEAAVDAAEGIQDPHQRLARIRSELVAITVWTPDGPAFGSADDVGGLLQHEADQLGQQVLAGLATVSPTYGRSAWRAWAKALEQGAEHPSNIADAMLRGQCADQGAGGSTPRPDLYFGAPLADLTDGQIMAYRAAREVVAKSRKKQGA